MKYFTHYWKNDTWEKNRNQNPKGSLLEHLSGSRFRKSRIETGDIGYVVTLKKGKLYLCGKMIVGNYCDVFESARVTGLKPEQLWPAPEHLIASKATVMLWDLEVSVAIAKQLKFVVNNRIKTLIFEPPGMIYRQTLRGVRLLSPDSAKLLDKFLGRLKKVELFNAKEVILWKNDAATGENDDDEFESYVEGNKKQKYVTYYERIPKNRRQAVKIHGVTCKGCGCNFEKNYGLHGKDFIHVHHIHPVSKLEKPKKINPATDLTVLCPNCHSMVHRYKNKTLSVEELKLLLIKKARG